MENIPSLSECFEILKEKKLHITFAESCTGGLCAKALTDLAGASEVIEASVVSYSNRIKIEKLGVKAETIEKHTEVSAECALEMARGAKKFAAAEVGAALTGCGTERKRRRTCFCRRQFPVRRRSRRIAAARVEGRNKAYGGKPLF